MAPQPFALALAAALLAAAPSPATARSPHQRHPRPERLERLERVRAPGGPFLTDSAGRRLELRGVNLVAKCGRATRPSDAPGTPCVPGPVSPDPGYVLTPGAADPGRRFTAADARTLRDLGFSVVRLGLIWEGLEPGPRGARADDPRYCAPHRAGTPHARLGSADPFDQRTLDAYLRRTDRTIALLARAGIRVILDLHQDAWGSAFANPASPTPWTGEGAPRWATCTDGRPFGSPAGWQGAYGDPAVEAAIGHFLRNDVRVNLQGQLARVWREVASHYRTSRAVVGYDLFNEPTDLRAAPAVLDRVLQCLYAGSDHAPRSCGAVPWVQARPRGLIPVVLDADRHHLVFYEASVLTDFGAPQTIGITERLPFSRLVLSFHVYGPSGATGAFTCSDPSCAAAEATTLAGVAAERAATHTRQPGGPAWLLSEFGAEDYLPDLARVAAQADERLLSWTYWAGLQLHDPTGSPTEGLIDEATRRADPARVAVLARAYPLATAGTPLRQAFDPATGAFDLTYRPDRAVQAPTQVVVPPARYPGGYRISVRGGRVTGRHPGGRVDVRPRRGARTVHVRVRAR
jgi:endoglycosylceramidase